MKNKWGILTVLIICASVMLGLGKYNVKENENDQWNNELKDENSWKREGINGKSANSFKPPAINQQRREMKKTTAFYEDASSDNYGVDTIFSNAKVTRIQGNSQLWTSFYTLTGHGSSVFAVAFSPDGSMLASGSVDDTVKLWDINTGMEIRTLTGHSSWVYSVTFSPDGSTLASGSGDDTVKLWDINTGTEIRTLTGHSSWVYSVAFSPDGTTLASGSGDDTIKLWDINTGMEIRTLTGHSGGVYSVTFSPDDSTLASGSGDDTVKLWDINTGMEIRTLTGHSGCVNSVAFSPDGTTLASGSWDNTVKLWNISTGTEIRTLTGHSSWVYSVAFSPDGTTLASGSQDHTIKLWDINTGTEIRTLTGHGGYIWSVAFSPDGTMLASGSSDDMIKLWMVDSDLDGMPDFWEYQNQFNANDGTDAVEDADGDWISNLAEYRARTDPRDALSVPLLSFSILHFIIIITVILLISFILGTLFIFSRRARKALVRQFEAPDYEIAMQIQLGKFANYQQYQEALRVGAKNYTQLQMVKDLKAPDYETAAQIQLGKFANYQQYQEAQRVGAKNHKQLQMVKDLKAPDYETAVQIRRGKFPNYQQYQEAQRVGAKNHKQLQMVKDLEAPDYETAVHIQRGKILNYQQYQEAQRVGAENIEQLQLVKHYQVPDYSTAIERQREDFTKQIISLCRQDRELTFSVIASQLQVPEDRILPILRELIRLQLVEGVLEENKRLFVSALPTEDEIRRVKDFISNIREGIPVVMTQIANKTKLDGKRCERIIAELTSGSNPAGEFLELEGVFIKSETTMQAIDQLLRQYSELESDKSAKQ